MAPPLFETLTLAVEDRIAVLTLNRPKARNAIDDEMRLDLKAAVDHLGADRAIRGVLLTGAGGAFCSGGDVKGMQERLEEGARAGELGWWRQREFHETLTKIYHLGVPTLAAVNGPAFGLGLDVALTCDFVWFADTAEVAVNFVRRGLVSDGGGFFHLPRRVGVARAKEMFFSGRSVGADEALSLGIADKVVAADALVGEGATFLRGFAEHPQTAQAMAKSILNRTFELGFEQVNMLASEAQAFCYSSADHQELVRAFFAERDAARARKAAS